MFKIIRFGALTVGTGVIIGLGAVGWLYTHKANPVAAPEPSTSGNAAGSDLTVVGNGAQGLPQQGQSLGASTGSSASDNSGSDSSNQLPTPSQFHVYDQYKNNPTAMYIDVSPGSGQAIAQGSAVTMQFRGWLTNGQEFGESYAGGKPFTFTEGAGGVLPGIAEAMFGMKAGGQRRLIIPPAVGYGAAGLNSAIPPDAVLIVDVQLISVK